MTRLPTHVGVLIAFVLFGGHVMAAEAPIAPGATTPAAATKAGNTTDGKYYLIWRVTAPKVEVGAEVEVEPAFFTNGEKIVFAWDYCRQRYVRESKPKHIPVPYIRGPQKILDPDYVLEPNEVGEDLSAVHDYCDYKNVLLDGSRFVLLENHGVRLKIGSVRFDAPPQKSWFRKRYYEPFFPNTGQAKITRLESRPPDKFPAAMGMQQGFGFLMSSNVSILEALVPNRRPTPPDARKLEAALKLYVEMRKTDQISSVRRSRE